MSKRLVYRKTLDISVCNLHIMVDVCLRRKHPPKVNICLKKEPKK